MPVMPEVDSWRDQDFDPVQTRRFKKRLYDFPGYNNMTNKEFALHSELKSHMKRSVLPLLKRHRNAAKTLYRYVHNSDYYKNVTAYAFGSKKTKPRDFDLLQKILHSRGLTKGCPREMILYRAVNAREMNASYWNLDEKFYDDYAAEDAPMFVNRNISTSVSPMVALDFLNKKEPGTKCCLLIFRIPKGYPYIYMPGLFQSTLARDEREVFLPSGEYYAEEVGFSVKIHPKLIGMQAKMGKNPVSMNVLVLTPYRRYSPFITGPKHIYNIPYLVRKAIREKSKPGARKSKPGAKKSKKRGPVAKKSAKARKWLRKYVKRKK